ncbi:MAG: hypothetical protein JXA68_10340 [Ignavibacteriales bacterium]|nr:hypothetical protein [Ignavibacteriales bacterium]
MKKFIFILLFITLNLYCQSLLTMNLGGVDLSLGDSKSIVIKSLEKNCIVSNLSENMYSLVWKSSNKLIGCVIFDSAEKLISIQKDWGYLYGTAVDDYEILFNILYNLQQEGEFIESSFISDSRQPSGNIKTIILYTKNKEVKITILRSSEYGNNVNVSEQLNKRISFK